LYGGSRHYHLKRRYGIGSAEVDALIAVQGNRCPVAYLVRNDDLHDITVERARGPVRASG
jgi:hypothetical protein